MKQPSSPSDTGLFGAILGRASVVDDELWLRALLDVEAALARACARVGLLTSAEAEAVTAACGQEYDVARLGAEAAASGNPVVPLVPAIAERAAAGTVHYGATSQDILDSAMMLVARRALESMLTDMGGAADAAARLAAEHRDTAMIGRTLLQQAEPTTFGLKAACWVLGLDSVADRLRAVVLPVQLGAAAGTLAAYRDHGPDMLAALADELGLAEPVLPWHTTRLPVTDLAGALGSAAAVLGKTALDVVLLAQTEVGEVREGVADRGGSSSMPHKNNPVAAVSARAAAIRAPGLVATLLTCAQSQEHERAAGAWHAEWPTVSDLLNTIASAAAWLRDCLENLVVDVDRMAHNVPDGATHGTAALIDRALAARGGT